MGEVLENPVLKVDNLRKTYKKTGFFKKGLVKALRGVSFTVTESESFGVVGESGCGKSTLCRIICGLDREFEGTVILLGKDINDYGKELGRKIQIVFQNPYSSLNPLMKIGDIVFEGPNIHGLDVKNIVMNMLDRMGFEESVLDKYPHQLSGGERQRIAILRALAMEPKVLVADEPLSALDLSTQAEILELFEEIKKELNLTLIFVSHDLRVVKDVTDRVVVMYRGVVVEEGPSKEVFESPMHPYTKELVSSIPASHPRERKNQRKIWPNEETKVSYHPGKELCPFITRCPVKTNICFHEHPKRIKLPGRTILCHIKAH